MQRYYIEVVNVKTDRAVKGVIEHRNIQVFMNSLAEHNLYAPSCIPVDENFNIDDIVDVDLDELETIN